MKYYMLFSILKDRIKIRVDLDLKKVSAQKRIKAKMRLRIAKIRITKASKIQEMFREILTLLSGILILMVTIFL